MNDLKEQIEKIAEFFNSTDFNEEILSIGYNKALSRKSIQIHSRNIKFFKRMFKHYSVEPSGDKFDHLFAYIGECKVFCLQPIEVRK